MTILLSAPNLVENFRLRSSVPGQRRVLLLGCPVLEAGPNPGVMHQNLDPEGIG